LSHYGADYWGTKSIGKQGGTVIYRVYGGYHPLDLNGGYAVGIASLTGTAFTSGGSNEFGGDLRWDTPLKGLLVGASALVTGLDGTSASASFHVPYITEPVYYAKFERGKFLAAGEYKRDGGNIFLTFNLPGGGTFTQPSNFDIRSWYAMTEYQVLPKFHMGAYYSHYTNLSTAPGPSRFSNDAVISGRYDFTPHLYMKLEGHFIDGTAIGYYNATNPNGEKPKTKMLAARMGYTF
jgi:hypothetical protein